jgi:hypothetical protein
VNNETSLKPSLENESLKQFDRGIDYDKLRIARTMNDHVEFVFMELYPEEKFRNLLQAVWPEDSVNGTLELDDAEAAAMIQEGALFSASETIRRLVGRADRKTVVKALKVVMRRYGISRTQRRKVLANDGGRIIPEELGETCS